MKAQYAVTKTMTVDHIYYITADSPEVALAQVEAGYWDKTETGYATQTHPTTIADVKLASYNNYQD